ncbi:ABC transporter ATP-binding protein [Treponema denticola]|uniref:ABC transporter ATP-binding protein n=1 Tax=Treponema denticola TaxID=158 RepID=UPI0020A32EA8|nr:ABC transporter ATP-binding protein [Treponema denticola]UTC83666.1 ABC transporter ATP-binding protein [Treponema denticola]
MNILELKNVSKSFPRTDIDDITVALSDISLTVKDGEFVSLVGPSGCGKSTILRLIAGLIPPTKGELILNGKQIEGPAPNRGMVFQQPTLFPWLTVKQNASFSPKILKTYKQKEKRLEQLIETVGLTEFSDSYPHQLSGGMAQRVALVRTMINEPEVFLMDEPLGALDAFTRMNMQDELLGMWQDNGHVMLLVTHDVDEAIYMSTRVIVMAPRPGRIRADIPIELEYPRNRTGETFIKYRNQIMDMLDFGKIGKEK